VYIYAYKHSTYRGIRSLAVVELLLHTGSRRQVGLEDQHRRDFNLLMAGWWQGDGLCQQEAASRSAGGEGESRKAAVLFNPRRLRVRQARLTTPVAPGARSERVDISCEADEGTSSHPPPQCETRQAKKAPGTIMCCLRTSFGGWVRRLGPTWGTCSQYFSSTPLGVI
jgi:hypothetical protein